MLQDKENNYHCEEAQEILGRIPSWTIRWGISVIFCIFVGIILGSYFIKYPERVIGSITITTSNSPVDVVSKIGGSIERINVSNGDFVKEGDIIGALHTSAEYIDILYADTCISIISMDTLKKAVFYSKLYEKYTMGTIQDDWTSFVLSCQRYKDYITRSVILKKRMLVGEQIKKQKEYYHQMLIQFTTMKEDLSYEKKNFVRDSLLFIKKYVSEKEYEESARRILQINKSIMSFKSQLTSAELSILQLEQQLVELSIQNEDDTLKMEEDIRTNIERLKAKISNWKLTNLFISPISGVVSFVHRWDEGQFINAGEHFLTIVPAGEKSVIGIVKIPQASFGKVRIGQKVNVKLDGYPYMEYGMLMGTIHYISSVPEESMNNQHTPHYTAEILFNNGMVSTYGKELRMIQKMDGKAEIITEERRLIMRFLDPIITLFKNGI